MQMGKFSFHAKEHVVQSATQEDLNQVLLTPAFTLPFLSDKHTGYDFFPPKPGATSVVLNNHNAVY